MSVATAKIKLTNKEKENKMGLAIGLLIKGFKIRKSIPKFIEVFTCKECYTLASVSVVNEKIKITKCKCV
jgi:hypothetical protein